MRRAVWFVWRRCDPATSATPVQPKQQKQVPVEVGA